jgi:hypothetical protein
MAFERTKLLLELWRGLTPEMRHSQRVVFHGMGWSVLTTVSGWISGELLTYTLVGGGLLFLVHFAFTWWVLRPGVKELLEVDDG